METITNEQLYSEIETIKREVRQLRETVTQYQVAPVVHPYIIRVEGVQGGEPITRNSYISVRTIVEQTRLGVTPDEFVKGHPPMALAEYYDALSYYHDHTDEMEKIIQGHRDALVEVIEISKRFAKPKA
ncbi:MAG: DUF433 domain-containing protein [Chloroflexi bacterium]|nr:DUF433 domain-containing protein [Chloroflexota bacterium]